MELPGFSDIIEIKEETFETEYFQTEVEFVEIPSTSADCQLLNEIENYEEIPKEPAADPAQPQDNQSNYQIFEIKRNSLGEFECPVCRAYFKISANLERHVRIHDKKYVYSVKNIKDVRVESAGNLVCDQKIYTCDYCSKTFEYKVHYTRHLRIEHTDRNKKYHCRPCNYFTDDQYDIQTHFNNHEKYKKIEQIPDAVKCPICPALLKNKQNLNRHMCRAHSIGHRYQCHKCDKGFTTRYYLLKHTKECAVDL
jgi:Zinc finger, C2H2 type